MREQMLFVDTLGYIISVTGGLCPAAVGRLAAGTTVTVSEKGVSGCQFSR